MAEGFKIAEAFVVVKPDTEGFKDELKAKLDEATAGLDAKVKVGLDTADFDAKADEVKAKIDEIAGKEASVKLGADSADLDAKTDAAKGKVDEVGAKKGTAKLSADAGDLDAKTDDAKAKVDEVSAKKGTAKLDADDAAAKAKIDELKAELDRLKLAKQGIKIDADASAAEIKIAQLQAQIEALKEESSSGGGLSLGGFGMPGGMMGGLAAGLAALSPGIGGAATGLGLLGGTGALAFGGIATALSAAHQASQNLGMTSAQVASTQFSNAVQVQQAQQQIQQAQMQSAQDSVQSAAQIQQAQMQVGQAHRQAAEDAITSAQSIEQAQMNLASVERNAAASQIQAEQQVKQSQQGLEESNYGLSEAQYNLSQAWVQARENITNLNNALADNRLNVKSAQLAVQQAELNQRLVDQNAYSTDIQRQQAALAVAQAKQQVTDAQAQETQSQIAANLANKQGVNGSQAVIQAKQGVTQATYAQQNAQTAYIAAQRNLVLTELNNATQVKEAQMAVAAAQRQAAYQQIQDAQAVRQAQMNLTMAQEQAAYTQQRDAIAVAQAQKNLSNTITEQRLAWAATMSTQNQAANQFARDMARLTPAGRAFVDQILSMRGAWRQFEVVAQNTVLPGVTVWLQGIKTLLPSIEGGIGRMGTAISNAFGQFGKQMQTPGFAKVLNGLIDNGIRFSNIVLPAFASFIQELARIGAQKGAIDGLANLLAGLANGLTNLEKGLAPFTSSLSSVFSTLGSALAAIGGPLGQVIGALASALAPVLQALLPGFKALVTALGNGLAAALTGIGPLLGVLGTAVSNIVIALAPLLPQIGRFIGQLAQELMPVMQALLPVITQLAQTVGFQLGAELAIVMNAVLKLLPPIAGLVVAISPLLVIAAKLTGVLTRIIFEALTPLANAMTSIVGGALSLFTTALQNDWKIIGDVTSWLWHNVMDPAWHGIAAGAMWLWQNVIQPMVLGIKLQFQMVEQATLWLWHNVFDPMWHGIASGAEWLWHNVLDPVWQGIEQGASIFVGAFTTIWDKLEGVFRTPVNFLIGTVYDKGIAKFWNDVVSAVGLGSLKLPIIPTLAHGGVMPGYSPGHDTQLAAVSPGEGILTPQATHAIGGASTVNALNKAYPPSSSKPAAGAAFGSMLAKLPEGQAKRHLAERPAEHIATAGKFANGGVAPGSSTGGRGGALGAVNQGGAAFGPLQGIIGGAINIGKIVAALATGNTTALANALGKFIGTTAAGNLAKVMVGIPKTLAGDLVHALMGTFTGGGGGGGGSLPGGSTGAVGNLPANWRTIASFLASHGFTKFAAAGVAGNILAESGGNPEILEIGGGGGGGLIQWTPYPPGYITGNYQADLMTQLNAILSWGGGPGLVNRATSPSNAALIYQDYYERPANLTASLPTRMAGANAVAKAMGWGSFDSGGWMQGPPNFTGKPEAVLTPDESTAFVALVKRLVSQPGGAPGAGVTVIQNYNGPQMPSHEQLAEMDRRLALAVGGA